MITEKPSPADAPAVRHHRRPAWQRHLAHWARWLHIYISMASFGILFFFAVTGLTLNHARWFAKQQKTVQRQGQVEAAWVKPKDPARLEIVEHLRAAHAIRGALSDFRCDESQCSVSFKGPGYSADAFIERATGAYELSETRMGFWNIINDLHKGRDSGGVWSFLIDLSAVIMTFVSLSGIVLLLYLNKYRRSGLVAILAGGALSVLIYAIRVP